MCMENKTKKNVRIKNWYHFPTIKFLDSIKTVSEILKVENLFQENLMEVNQTKQRYKL